MTSLSGARRTRGGYPPETEKIVVLFPRAAKKDKFPRKSGKMI